MQTNYSYVIADHIKAACFIISDGIKPSAKQQGYVLRRLIRRSLSAAIKIGIDITNKNFFEAVVDSICTVYAGVYDELYNSKEIIVDLIFQEAQKYNKAISIGKKEWEKILAKNLHLDSDELARKTWDFYQTFGVPFEVSEDVLHSHDLKLNNSLLAELIENHQKTSQTASVGQFKSGLGEENQKTIRLHTTTHILHQVLREIFGNGVRQMGSAITSEKARFDFTYDENISQDDILIITHRVQELINKHLVMDKREMSEPEARKLGAIGLFGEKYGEKVTVYSLIDDQKAVFSREFCGGPHVSNTSEIGTFLIIRQKSIGQGLKRIEFDVQ